MVYDLCTANSQSLRVLRAFFEQEVTEKTEILTSVDSVASRSDPGVLVAAARPR